ncbi:hypothetical protein [Streptomyces sp. NBC_01483]|uniref:hypothetical protein n=1 Tax=Streptomyces sp. NBC_01483 TaxID=2903883 RepID=UPI002E2F4D4D|nr:hypothetical protein [Streptomyces sp. NBC_01483]
MPLRSTGQPTVYEATGVDEVVLNVTGVWRTYGTRAALDGLKGLLAALAREPRLLRPHRRPAPSGPGRVREG